MFVVIVFPDGLALLNLIGTWGHAPFFFFFGDQESLDLLLPKHTFVYKAFSCRQIYPWHNLLQCYLWKKLDAALEFVIFQSISTRKPSQPRAFPINSHANLSIFVFKQWFSLAHSHARSVALTGFLSEVWEIVLRWVRRVNCTPSLQHAIFSREFCPCCSTTLWFLKLSVVLQDAYLEFCPLCSRMRNSHRVLSMMLKPLLVFHWILSMLFQHAFKFQRILCNVLLFQAIFSMMIQHAVDTQRILSMVLQYAANSNETVHSTPRCH